MPVVMQVVMYTPAKMYGFCNLSDEDPAEKVFFHAGVFEAGQWPGLEERPPPPLTGEEVLVEVQAGPHADKSPRAIRVVRLHEPKPLTGIVDTFNPDSGWGFVQASDGQSYYLHRSEVEEGRLPLVGQAVSFYAGSKRGRPRACYVRLGRVG